MSKVIPWWVPSVTVNIGVKVVTAPAVAMIRAPYCAVVFSVPPDPFHVWL